MNTQAKSAKSQLFNTVEIARQLGLTISRSYPLDEYGMIEVQEPVYYPTASCVKRKLSTKFNGK